MKTAIKLFSLFFLLGLTVIKTSAQSGSETATGLPGDNFDLQGALQMFQKASSPEDFEKLLNSQDNNVNNLDLNDDGETDYIKVIDKSDKDVHAFVLQIPVSETESQDIAIIELEKTGAESASIQIVGDADIYGEEIIVEPKGEGEDNALIDGYNSLNNSGPSAYLTGLNAGIIVNVWFWPSVRFIYGTGYRPWISPWRWRHYPLWWHPWKPLAWNLWHPRRMIYHRGFVVVTTNRIRRAHVIYTPYRTTSVTVRTRHAAAINNYRITRTKTTVTGPRGNTATRTSTTVSGRKVKVKKTRVRRH